MKNPDVDAGGLYEILWDDGVDFNPKGGELMGLLDIRDSDGSAGTFKGVPYYMRQLNHFAKTFAEAINEIHKTAYDLMGDYTEAGGCQNCSLPMDVTLIHILLTQNGIRTAKPRYYSQNITISKEY